MPTEYMLELWGELLSHKNQKFAVRRKRKRDTAKGVAGSYYRGIATKPEARKSMQDAAFQIPGHMRNLYLRHPEIELQCEVARSNVDRDNILSTTLDILTEYGVLENDNTSTCNGTIILHPARVTGHWRTLITLRCPTLDEKVEGAA